MLDKQAKLIKKFDFSQYQQAADFGLNYNRVRSILVLMPCNIASLIFTFITLSLEQDLDWIVVWIYIKRGMHKKFPNKRQHTKIGDGTIHKGKAVLWPYIELFPIWPIIRNFWCMQCILDTMSVLFSFHIRTYIKILSSKIISNNF